jgi:glutathione S-transferase
LETDEAQVTKHVTALSGRLDVYEKILSKQKYLAGDELSVADLFHLPYGVKVYNGGHGDLIDSRPNVKRCAC